MIQRRFGTRLATIGTALTLLALSAACASSNNNAAKSSGGGSSAAPLSAALSPTAAAGATFAANIQGIAFPATITVSPGTTVTWTNRDGVPHTVTADAGAAQSFDSDPIAPNASFSVTFAKAGTYPYHCKIHASMHGTVVVGDQPTGATPASTTPAKSSSPYDPGYKY